MALLAAPSSLQDLTAPVLFTGGNPRCGGLNSFDTQLTCSGLGVQVVEGRCYHGRTKVIEGERG